MLSGIRRSNLKLPFRQLELVRPSCFATLLMRHIHAISQTAQGIIRSIWNGHIIDSNKAGLINECSLLVRHRAGARLLISPLCTGCNSHSAVVASGVGLLASGYWRRVTGIGLLASGFRRRVSASGINHGIIFWYIQMAMKFYITCKTLRGLNSYH